MNYLSLRFIFSPTKNIEKVPIYIILIFIISQIILAIKLYNNSKQIEIYTNHIKIRNLFTKFEINYSEIKEIKENHQFTRGGISSEYFQIVTENKKIKFEKAFIKNYDKLILKLLEINKNIA